MTPEGLQFLIYGSLISAVWSVAGASFIVKFTSIKGNKRAK